MDYQVVRRVKYRGKRYDAGSVLKNPVKSEIKPLLDNGAIKPVKKQQGKQAEVKDDKGPEATGRAEDTAAEAENTEDTGAEDTDAEDSGQEDQGDQSDQQEQEPGEQEFQVGEDTFSAVKDKNGRMQYRKNGQRIAKADFDAAKEEV